MRAPRSNPPCHPALRVRATPSHPPRTAQHRYRISHHAHLCPHEAHVAARCLERVASRLEGEQRCARGRRARRAQVCLKRRRSCRRAPQRWRPRQGALKGCRGGFHAGGKGCRTAGDRAVEERQAGGEGVHQVAVTPCVGDPQSSVCRQLTLVVHELFFKRMSFAEIFFGLAAELLSSRALHPITSPPPSAASGEGSNGGEETPAEGSLTAAPPLHLKPPSHGPQFPQTHHCLPHPHRCHTRRL